MIKLVYGLSLCMLAHKLGFTTETEWREKLWKARATTQSRDTNQHNYTTIRVALKTHGYFVISAAKKTEGSTMLRAQY